MNKQKRNTFFDWSRLFFAGLVMLSHALVLKTGNEADWLANWVGHETFGSVGVKGFFILSGYFVLPSLLMNEISSRHYVVSRLFRIFPGLIVCVVACMIFGSLLSTVPKLEYWSAKEVWQYLFYNGLGIEPRYALPGVFLNNPFPNSVNGSLWTLPLEIRCYLSLLFLWFLGFFRDVRISSLALLIIFVAGMTDTPWVGVLFGNPYAGPYVACFALGAMCRIHGWDQKVSLVSLVVIAVALWLFWNSPLHNLIFGVALAAGIFFTSGRAALVKYLPELPEDISYGVYLYAYLVQQTIIQFKPEWSLSMQLCVSFIVVLAIAYLARIFIEKPALKIKDTLLQRNSL